MILSPSMLSSDFGNFQAELLALELAGISWVHWDVMDGHFTPNITFGPPVLASLRPRSSLFFDVHLMINAPERYIGDFAKAGADLLVVHAEASLHLNRTIQQIHDNGMKAGAALNPSTPVCALENVLDDLDFILIMSVNPGFGGQSFLPRTFDKLAAMRKMADASGRDIIIQVDGGVCPENTAQLLDAGADSLVSGSAFFVFPPYKDRRLAFDAAAAQSTRKALACPWQHKNP